MNNIRIIKILIIISTFIFFTVPTLVYSQYKLEKVSEFEINSLYSIEIVDFYPKDLLYLGYKITSAGKRIVLVNYQGDIIIDKILVGEGPNRSSAPFNSMSFSPEGNILLQTSSQIYRFDQKINFINKFSYLSSTTIQIYGRMEFLSFFHFNESLSSFSFITNPSDTNSFRPGSENSMDLIEIYQVDKNKLFKMADVKDRIMYNKFEKYLLANLYFITYTIDPKNKQLYLTTKIDSEIIVYDLILHKFESRIKIKHGDFEMLNKNLITKSDFPSYGRVSLGPKNHKLFLLDGGKIVLDYIREIPYGTYEKKISEDPTYHHFQDPSYHRLILFDSAKQLSGDIALPKNGKLMTSLPGDRLLFQIIDPDVEEDFILYSIYEVVATIK